MSPGHVRQSVVTEKAQVVREMLAGIESLPLGDLGAFTRDLRMVAAGESYLRRGLEALLDLGRHILAKGFGSPTTEYKAIADELGQREMISEAERATFLKMAGYRNRLVHFYDDIHPPELYEILTEHRDDLRTILDSLLASLDTRPGLLDPEL